MIAQARSILTTDEPDRWFLVEGDSKGSVLEQLRVRASVACGKAVLTMVRAPNTKRETVMDSLFPEGKALPFVVEVKWSDDADPERVEFELTRDAIIGDLMAKLLAGEL